MQRSASKNRASLATPFDKNKRAIISRTDKGRGGVTKTKAIPKMAAVSHEKGLPGSPGYFGLPLSPTPGAKKSGTELFLPLDDFPGVPRARAEARAQGPPIGTPGPPARRAERADVMANAAVCHGTAVVDRKCMSSATQRSSAACGQWSADCLLQPGNYRPPLR